MIRAARALLWRLIRSVLFRLDPETAHRTALSLLHSRIPFIRILAPAPPRQAQSWNVFGIDFSSPVGLAAGFDKDAEILAGLPSLGFGFAEIGTVTPRPQPGNDRPRLFRDPAHASLFNRMGFPGLGATIVALRVARARETLPPGFRVGVNIGKNKDTPLERAAEDYRKAIAPFRDLADYVVINVSSPNTPGLRSLQTQEALEPILSEVNEELEKWSRKPPLLLKLAPELCGAPLAALASGPISERIQGWVLTNTWAGEMESGATKLAGGWSGGALAEAARRSLREVRAASRLQVISVGGILDADEARARIELGASLVQIYTGWIYRGPAFPAEIARKLAENR